MSKVAPLSRLWPIPISFHSPSQPSTTPSFSEAMLRHVSKEILTSSFFIRGGAFSGGRPLRHVARGGSIPRDARLASVCGRKTRNPLHVERGHVDSTAIEGSDPAIADYLLVLSFLSGALRSRLSLLKLHRATIGALSPFIPAARQEFHARARERFFLVRDERQLNRKTLRALGSSNGQQELPMRRGELHLAICCLTSVLLNVTYHFQYSTLPVVKGFSWVLMKFHTVRATYPVYPRRWRERL